MRKLLGLAIATLSLAALLPAQGRWNLDVECGKLKPVSLQTGPTTWETWWYVVVTVKNGTGAERHMNFTARAETDTRKTAPAVFRPRVLQEIEAKEGKSLANLISLRGALADGEKMDAVVILAGLDPLATNITVHIQGLASYLYKDGLALIQEVREFQVPMFRQGDEFEVHRNPVKKLMPRWVVLERKKVR